MPQPTHFNRALSPSHRNEQHPLAQEPGTQRTDRATFAQAAKNTATHTEGVSKKSLDLVTCCLAEFWTKTLSKLQAPEPEHANLSARQRRLPYAHYETPKLVEAFQKKVNSLNQSQELDTEINLKIEFLEHLGQDIFKIACSKPYFNSDDQLIEKSLSRCEIALDQSVSRFALRGAMPWVYRKLMAQPNRETGPQNADNLLTARGRDLLRPELTVGSFRNMFFAPGTQLWTESGKKFMVATFRSRRKLAANELLWFICNEAADRDGFTVPPVLNAMKQIVSASNSNLSAPRIEKVLIKHLMHLHANPQHYPELVITPRRGGNTGMPLSPVEHLMRNLRESITSIERGVDLYEAMCLNDMRPNLIDTHNPSNEVFFYDQEQDIYPNMLALVAHKPQGTVEQLERLLSVGEAVNNHLIKAHKNQSSALTFALACPNGADKVDFLLKNGAQRTLHLTADHPENFSHPLPSGITSAQPQVFKRFIHSLNDSDQSKAEKIQTLVNHGILADT